MPRSTTRTAIVLTVVLVLVVAGAIVAFSPISPFGSRTSGGEGGGVLGFIFDTADELQQWVGKQLLAIANDHLGPELAFERIDYQPPMTVLLTNVTLDDGPTRLVDARSIRITLAETPKKGQPIVIESVELEGPVINIEQTAAGKIAGFNRLVDSMGGARHADGGSTRLRDVFDIRRIAVDGATINYRQLDAPAMRLDGLSADLDTTPAEEGAAGSWYTIACTVGRDPIAALTIDGKLDLDSLMLELAGYEFDAQLSPGQYEMLPPSAQVMLSDHEVRGAINAQGSGTLALRDFGASNLSMVCAVSDMHLLLGAYRVLVQHGNITAALGENGLAIQSAKLQAFEGNVQISGQVGLAEAQPFSVTLTASDVNLAQLVASGSSESTTSMQGILAGHCRANGNLDEADGALSGDGEFEITQAQLARILVIDGLLKAMKKVSTVGERSDRGNGAFELHNNRLYFTTFEFISQSVAARGEGDVHFDGALDLKVNAGPLERVQGALGKVGDIFGKITDRLVSYRVTGTVESPKYAVEPLGFKLKVPFVGGKSGQASEGM